MAKKRKSVASTTTKNDEATERDAGGDGGVKKQKRLPRRQGALRYIMEIPLDVLFEILGYLDPIDVLRLSRTSKDLRRILLSRSSVSVWKAARTNLGVPDPIPSMSEPAFANLLFDPHCHFCLTATVHNIAWNARLRCCKACLPIHFASAAQIQARGLLTDLCPEILWKAIPYYPLDNGSCGQRRWHKVDEVYLISGAEEVSPHASRMPTDSESTKWMVNRLETLLVDIEQSSKCKKWMEQRNADRGRELFDARESRYNAIIVKLEAMGWEHELTFAQGRQELKQHKFVNQPKPLTDRIWQNIKQPLAEFMQTIKAERLKREHKEVCQKRYKLLADILRERESTLTDELVMPSSIDVSCWKPVKSVIEDLPTEAGAEDSMFNEILEELPLFIQDWNREKAQVLLAALQVHDPEATEADLRLATSLFRCQHYLCMRTKVASFPAILSHRPFHRGWSSTSPPLAPWLSQSAQLSSDCIFKLHKTGSQNTRKVMELCGLDCMSTTTEEMLVKNPLVECKDCTTEAGVRLFMRWTRAITHGHDDNPEAPHFVLPSKAATRVIKAHESTQSIFQPSQDRPWYRCKRCHESSPTLTGIKQHLKAGHDIESTTEIAESFRFMGYVNLEGPIPVRVIPHGVGEGDLEANFRVSDLYLK
ncbi:hypothetical protein E1B28_012816 [Marasmius oreades]|uniref:F-box domain-containing protein n=1 Tax=Marasmius oreades TaxID=181124 RepID=A0A9P7UNN5_9AGAR|nr:uncharacterized protein E1B28_012816 [Marasmius oreades]KAG7088862.1 hypothetical protein E1B28_012816 [Marasmius oreades]